jgi:hypothetical protein
MDVINVNEIKSLSTKFKQTQDKNAYKRRDMTFKICSSSKLPNSKLIMKFLVLLAAIGCASAASSNAVTCDECQAGAGGYSSFILVLTFYFSWSC